MQWPCGRVNTRLMASIAAFLSPSEAQEASNDVVFNINP